MSVLKRKGQERADIYWGLSCIRDLSEMSMSHPLREKYLTLLNWGGLEQPSQSLVETSC